MKNVKMILPALAFILAVGAAFALDPVSSPSGQHSVGGCIAGTLQQSPSICDTDNTGMACTVEVVFNTTEIRDAYNNGNCGNSAFLLKRP